MRTAEPSGDIEDRSLRRSCTLLINDRAGALHAGPSLQQMEEMARDIGLDAEIISTRSADEMRRTIRRLVAAGVGTVAVAGGDGTVALAAQELALSGTALGVIPQGTANNFASALRLPMDLVSALRVLRDGVVRHVDLGRIGDRYFTEAAGVGLFADALSIYGAGTNKNILRALYSAARVALSLQAHRLRLTLDGEPHVERAVMCTVANTYRMAYAMPVAPEAKVTDGELDVVVVGDLRRSELIPYYRAVRAQMHLRLPKVTTLRAREVRIEARRPMNVHCDDRIIGTTPVTIRVEPRALMVLVEPL